MNICVCSKFRLKKKIGSGSFGEIYLGEQISNGELVAIKLEPSQSKQPLLFHETKIYKRLSASIGIPEVKWSGIEGDYNVIVMELLGDSLGTIFETHGKKFSLKTVLLIADQLLQRIEFIHNKGLLHRDIKPENFVVGSGIKSNIIYVIDFGISSDYLIPNTNNHIEHATGRQLTGTARYASIRNHLGNEPSRRDDLESIAYLLIYFLTGTLPWLGIKAQSATEKYEKIAKKKINTPIDTICNGIPLEFQTFLHETRRLEFADKPNYSLYREIFRNLFIREGFVYDSVYDWTKLEDIHDLKSNPNNRRRNSFTKMSTPLIGEPSPTRIIRRVKMPQMIAIPIIKHSRKAAVL